MDKKLSPRNRRNPVRTCPEPRLSDCGLPPQIKAKSPPSRQTIAKISSPAIAKTKRCERALRAIEDRIIRPTTYRSNHPKREVFMRQTQLLTFLSAGALIAFTAVPAALFGLRTAGVSASAAAQKKRSTGP